MTAVQRKITVIGAGIVGVASAINLQRDGHAVTLVDRGAPGEGASGGNAGVIVTGSFLPRSMPGTVKQVPGWLFDPKGPLFVRPLYAPCTLPWFLRFAAVGTAEKVETSAAALHSLNRTAMADHLDLAESAGAADLVRPVGTLKVYRTDAGFAGDAIERDMKEKFGFRVDVLGPDDIRHMEPALAPGFRHGVFLPDDGHTTDPHRLVQALAAHFEAAGGIVLRRDVRGFAMGPEGPTQIHTDGGVLDVDVLVVAAGAWSGRLAARLGSRIPVEAERGYHATIAGAGVRPSVPVYEMEAKIIATPQDGGLRITGISEFAGLDAPPDYARSRMLVGLGRRLFPGLETDQVSHWMGPRPSLPDSLPVIGRSPRHANVYYAFGHGHTGLTGGPTTGRLVADLVAGRTPSIDLAPFAADRF